jgi:hypothetical protein
MLHFIVRYCTGAFGTGLFSSLEAAQDAVTAHAKRIGASTLGMRWEATSNRGHWVWLNDRDGTDTLDGYLEDVSILAVELDAPLEII